MKVKRLKTNFHDELYHHGIKGQRWGIRRYQNPDGTLTEAGRARYGSVKKLEKAYTKQKNSFYKEVGSRFGAHNYAANKMNDGGFEKINKKYENEDFGNDYSSKAGQKYVKEINNTWNSHYKQYVKDIANKYDLLGEDFLKDNKAVKLENMYGYNRYDEYIIKR